MDTQIEYHGPTDTHGHCHFSLRWIDDYFPGHPEGEQVRRERGQHFLGGQSSADGEVVINS